MIWNRNNINNVKVYVGEPHISLFKVIRWCSESVSFVDNMPTHSIDMIFGPMNNNGQMIMGLFIIVFTSA